MRYIFFQTYLFLKISKCFQYLKKKEDVYRSALNNAKKHLVSDRTAVIQILRLESVI